MKDLIIEQYFENKKIFLTGGSGYIATNVVEFLKKINCEIVRFDLLRKFSILDDCIARVTDICGDIRDKNYLMDCFVGSDIIFHFAAQTSAYVAGQDPIVDYKINVLPMLNMLEICREKHISPSIVFSSTATICGVTKKTFVNDEVLNYPETVYDLHKMMAEDYLKYYSRQGFVKGVSLRLANVYGPGPKSSSADRGVLNTMTKKALRGENITIYGKGEFIRDYIHVKDVALAFLLAATNIDKLNSRNFVIGSGVGYTISDAFKLVAKCVQAKAGVKADVVSIDYPSEFQSIEKRDFVADSSAFKKNTGWEARYALKNGIDDMIDNFLHKGD